jgi:hypothetical protein
MEPRNENLDKYPQRMKHIVKIDNAVHYAADDFFDVVTPNLD